MTLGFVPLPRQCDRIAQLPSGGCRFMLLESVIEMHATAIFNMYKVKHTNVICVTRNADLDAAEGIEEQGDDYREQMKAGKDPYYNPDKLSWKGVDTALWKQINAKRIASDK